MSGKSSEGQAESQALGLWSWGGLQNVGVARAVRVKVRVRA